MGCYLLVSTVLSKGVGVGISVQADPAVSTDILPLHSCLGEGGTITTYDRQTSEVHAHARVWETLRGY